MRRLTALTALAIAVLTAIALVGELLSPAEPPFSQLGWSASQAWAVVVVGLSAGIAVALLLRPRWPRTGSLSGAGLAAGGLIVAAYGTLPGAALAVPACRTANAPASGPWQLEATTIVDGVVRDRRSLALDQPVVDGRPLLNGVLADLAPTATEDMGIERRGVDGPPLRHCRALVSGSQVTAALPMLAQGAGDARPLVPTELPIWRGDFDWWLSADGRLVGARFAVGGHPADAWPVDALRGQLRAEIWSVPR